MFLACGPFVRFCMEASKLRYFESREAARGQKTKAGFKAMDWNQYSLYMMCVGSNLYRVSDFALDA